jgi:hypothetical protein
MSFILGIIVGMCVGLLLLIKLDNDKKEKVFNPIDDIEASDAFDDGVSYGLMLNRTNGAIIAVNKDEIMVQYEDGATKRFREVTGE